MEDPESLVRREDGRVLAEEAPAAGEVPSEAASAEARLPPVAPVALSTGGVAMLAVIGGGPNSRLA